MSKLIGFMNGFWGRAIRAVLGIALIVYGLTTVGGLVGIVIAAVGLVALAMGLWGRCLLELAYHPTRSTA